MWGLPLLCRIKVARVGFLSYFWSYRKNFQFFIIEYDVIYMLVISDLYYVVMFFLYPDCWEVFFYHEGMLSIEWFFYNHWDYHVIFFSFTLLTWYITLNDLQMLKHPCNFGINPIWSWWMIFLIIAKFGLLFFCWGFLQLCSSWILIYNFYCSVLLWL